MHFPGEESGAHWFQQQDRKDSKYQQEWSNLRQTPDLATVHSLLEWGAMTITQATRLRALTLLLIEREQMLESLKRAETKNQHRERGKPPLSEGQQLPISDNCDRTLSVAS
jgi:hypothetical protein